MSRRWSRRAWGSGAIALLLAVAAGSQEGGGAPSAAPRVELDKLLKLPPSMDYSVDTRGGQTPGEWRGRFQRIRTALVSERQALEEAETRLEETASGSDAWRIAPPIPGAGSTADAPLDFQLRQEIRKRREEIAHLEQELQELEIEADLAGVPEAWRH